MRRLNIRNFKIAVIISFIIAGALLLLSFIMGKQQFFLLLNTDAGPVADHFFEWCTYAGDGLLWIVVVLIVFFILQRKDVLPLLISGFAMSTILTQMCKYLIVPDELRPTKAITNAMLVHTVSGVELHTVSSFPSGHTATAFCFYLLFCLLINKRWWLITGLIYALLVGYSRIYLAQHFPLDAGGGIIVGILSIIISLKFQQYWWRRKESEKNTFYTGKL